ncbi:MAG TPA: hypothetical protein VG206_11725 [Terriglobia bacterium]|nr:hypothetical protein [Terriglobia bacterium]
MNGTNCANTLAQELRYRVTAGEAYYTPGCTSSSQCVFPNAIIPQSAFSAPTNALPKYVPLPNLGSDFTTSANKETLRDDQAGARIDANTRLGMVSGYYFVDDYAFVNPYGATSVPGFSTTSNGRAQMINLGITKSFGASSVNELRLEYMRDLPFTQCSGWRGAPFGCFPGFTGIFPMQPQLQGVEQVSFNNFNIGASQKFLVVLDNTYEVKDNFSKVIGTHTLKFGGTFGYSQVSYKFTFALNGTFGFNGTETGSDWADFLIGAPYQCQQGLQLPMYSRGRDYAVYGQDSWRATQHLTVNYGLRWEVSTPWWETHNQVEGLLPSVSRRYFRERPTAGSSRATLGFPPPWLRRATTILPRAWVSLILPMPREACWANCWAGPARRASVPDGASIILL